MSDLRAAFIKCDQARIDSLEAQVDTSWDEDDAPELDYDPPVNKVAHENADDALKLLRPEGLVDLLADREENPDTLTLVQNALYITMAPSKRPRGADWESEKKTIEEQVGWRVAGDRDQTAVAKVETAVIAPVAVVGEVDPA